MKERLVIYSFVLEYILRSVTFYVIVESSCDNLKDR